MFPLKNRSLIDLPTLTNALNIYSKRYPYPDAKHITNPTEYTSTGKQFVPSKIINLQNTTALTNAYLQTIQYTNKSLNTSQSDELFRNTNSLPMNMYFYGDLEFTYRLPAETSKKLTELEINFNWSNYLVYCFTIIKREILGEPIEDIEQYLQFYDINKKKSHRDRMFDDIQTAYKKKDSHIKDYDTSYMLHNKESRLVKMKIEEYLKEVLQNAKEPKPDLARDVLKQIDKELHLITSLMFGRISSNYINFFEYTLMKIFRNSFQQILIDKDLIAQIQIHTAQKRGPIIFAPTHKSYFDFMLLSYITRYFNEQVPFIAAADNMAGILGVS